MTDDSRHTNRREFLAATGATTLSALVPQRPPGYARKRVALVGTGVRGINMWGRQIVQEYADDVEFVGLCDINPGRLAYGRDYMGVTCPVGPGV